MHARFLYCIALALAAQTAPAGTEIAELTERVVLHADGSADLSITVQPGPAPDTVLVLPFSHPLPDSIRTEGEGFCAEIRHENGARFLAFAGPWKDGVPGRLTMRIPAYVVWSSLKRAAYDNVTMRLAFTNTTPRRILRYRGDLILPEGYSVTSVVSSKPEQTEKDPVAPFEIIEESGRAGVSIRSPALGLGDGAFITFRAKPAGKSPVLMIALALAGVLYLLFYRDVLKENGNGPAAAQNPQS